jgi:hypothetical protein
MSEKRSAKRARAVARLSRPDACGLSDRALARELGVSQPFIGSVRRRLAAGEPVHTVTPDNEPAAREADLDVLGVGDNDEPAARDVTPHRAGLPAHQALAIERYGSIRPSWATPVDDGHADTGDE